MIRVFLIVSLVENHNLPLVTSNDETCATSPDGFNTEGFTRRLLEQVLDFTRTLADHDLALICRDKELPLFEPAMARVIHRNLGKRVFFLQLLEVRLQLVIVGNLEVAVDVVTRY